MVATSRVSRWIADSSRAADTSASAAAAGSVGRASRPWRAHHWGRGAASPRRWPAAVSVAIAHICPVGPRLLSSQRSSVTLCTTAYGALMIGVLTRGRRRDGVRRLATLCCALILLSFQAVAKPNGSAFAYGNCAPYNSQAPHYFDGYQGYTQQPTSWANTPEGVSGYLVNRVPLVCTNVLYPYTFSTQWLMIVDQTNYLQYAQVGIMIDNGAGCGRDFTEYYLNEVGSTFSRHIGACDPANRVGTYQLLYNGYAGPYPPCCGAYEMLTPGVDTYPAFDPWQRGWSFQPQFFGETTDTADDMPGTTASTADFSALGIQRVSDGQLEPVPCYLRQTISNPPTNYHANATSCDHFSIWTNPV